MKITKKFFLILLLLGILYSETDYFNYDYLELALTWPNSFCLTHDGTCREILPQYFTISHLRPRQRGGPDLQNCPTPYTLPNSTMEENKDDLLKFWPDLTIDIFQLSKEFWKNQWQTFGSCIDMSPEDYIVYVINDRKRNDLKKILKSAGINPDGRQYPPSSILQAFRNALGVTVNIVCEPDRTGNIYLTEIHQCFDYNGTNPIDCDNKAKGCDDKPIFPYAGFKPNNDPG